MNRRKKELETFFRDTNNNHENDVSFNFTEFMYHTLRTLRCDSLFYSFIRAELDGGAALCSESNWCEFPGRSPPDRRE